MFSPLLLPCGVSIKNRIGKSAMSENLADKNHFANERHVELYHQWAKGGSGLVITGNVMIDKRHLGEPGNVVVEKDMPLEAKKALQNWARRGTENNTQLWMQLNHPGRQAPQFLTPNPIAPSAVPLRKEMQRMFHPPRAMTEEEIEDLLERFVNSALIAQESGFSGVQIHGAHGYLVSQFLSPLTNLRQDIWKGAHFLYELIKRLRKALGNQYPIGIKLNSSDFQKGGLSEEDSIQIILNLEKLGIDLIEISGGSYEAPAMMTGKTGTVKNSTREREAYFLAFAEKLRTHTKVPIMLTGGFRTFSGMQSALESHATDMVGLARPLSMLPNWPNLMAEKKELDFGLKNVKPRRTGWRVVDNMAMLEILWYSLQLRKISEGKSPNLEMGPWSSIIQGLCFYGQQMFGRLRA